MSKGTSPQGRKCAFCGRNVYDVDAVWEYGQPYHDDCYKQYLAKQIGVLEKKMNRGTLSMVEAKELMDLTGLYEKIRVAPPTIAVSKNMLPNTPQFNGNTAFSNANLGNRLLAAKEKKALGDGQKKVKLIEQPQEK